MSYLGDFALESTFDTKFTTVSTSGAPTTLAGTPVISAYVGNSVTQITAGITLTVDFDTVTGLHNVRVVATAANGYATASNYQLVITTGTVGGTSVVGYVVGEFSIEARSAVRPTVAARTLDITATGAAGIDLANVENQGTTLGLTGTTILAATTATNLTTNNDKTGYGLSAAAVQAVWDALTTALTTAGSIGKKLADWVIGTTQTGDSFARLGAPAGASVSVDVAAVKVDTAAIKTKTDSLTFTVAGQVDANAESMNATTILGTGAAGDLWRG